MHKHALSAWFRTGLRHLLPCACALCGAVQGGLVCTGCTSDLAPQLHRRRCIQCAIALEARHAARHCRTCLAGAPDFDATIVIADYDWPLDHLVTGLKFRAQLPLAAWLAHQLGNALAAAPGDLPDVLLPVPLSPARLRSRGYNQAWEIARRLARQLDIPGHANALHRVRDNPAQAMLDRAERLTNLHGAFVVAEPARIAGRHVGVVDDVMTTGTTLGEIATQLKRAGATRVTNVVALRTP
ncbi:ComF family protein [Ralstonia sp. NFACC01]|jgi:ComF family protein|uniref:ComF family protein n=1 Tax=Ralstonia sp. NFACC01 TaxID=1566294 RepID=UPI0008F164AB|nr:ComF family protein [Ralstonia sp. NFACC01]SFP88764.1 comF family protein [Ralstonia sp. NFACC01]